jgi:hypothetical protein
MEGLFLHILKTIENEEFVHRHKTSQEAFTRDRKFSSKDLIINLISFNRAGVQVELDRFFKNKSSRLNSTVNITKSAFTQARRKIQPTLFGELNQLILDFYQSHSRRTSNWKSHRVVSIDGSLLNLPHSKDIENEFGGVPNQYENLISARCSLAYDVCNELVLDAIIDKRKSCEKEIATRHLNALNPETDVLVFDRGYPSQMLVGLLMEKGFKFCFRLSTNWKEAYKQIEQRGNDIQWTMTCRSYKGSSKLKKLKLPLQIDNLRLVSLVLPSGEKEVLLTNMIDRNQYHLEDLKHLYNLRWGVEEGYKTIKKVLNIEHFSGKTPLSVRQDFHARIIMMNISSMIRRQCFDNEKKTQHEVQVNKTQAIAKMKDFIVDLFYMGNVKKYLNQMLQILKDRIDIIRPFRSFERRDASSRRRHKMIVYKGI